MDDGAAAVTPLCGVRAPVYVAEEPNAMLDASLRKATRQKRMGLPRNTAHCSWVLTPQVRKICSHVVPR